MTRLNRVSARTTAAIAFLIAATIGVASLPQTVHAKGGLKVTPSSDVELYRSHDGTYTPKVLKYKLRKSGPGSVRWLLKRPRYLKANRIRGLLGSRPYKLKLKPDESAISGQTPGIYPRKLVFRSWRGAKRLKKVRRTYTLIRGGDPSAGNLYYAAYCASCHNLDDDTAGAPPLRDVYGRTAGQVSGYSYSSALVDYAQIWREQTLNAWMTDPQALVPGTYMNTIISGQEDRMDIIAYRNRVNSITLLTDRLVS